MNIMTRTHRSAYRAAASFAVVLAAGIAAYSPAVQACDACNRAFMHELVHGERADTLAGRDLLRAFNNQRELPLNWSLALAAASADTVAVSPAVAVSSSAAAAAPAREQFGAIFEGAEFIEIIERDEGLSIPATGFVPQDVEPDHVFTVELDEGRTYLGQGVMYDGFLTNGAVPGPTFVMQEGDIVRMDIVNKGIIPHGASIHAAYTQTSKYVGKIEPGETKSVTFRATIPGVYMYHCAPGGHAIPMHVLFGQYGMIVVEPRERKYKLEEELGHGPDLTLYLLQHEIYASGKDAVEGRAFYTAFNGKVFRYVEEPITARPGDYVRIHYLNVGPNRLSTFHIVGILWDYVYWQGHPDAWMPGGQTINAGPSDSWVIEFRVPPDEGAYVMLDHAVGAASRGTIGLLVADRNADTPKTVLAEGPSYSAGELDEMAADAVRTISPFKAPVENNRNPVQADRTVSYGPEVEEVVVQIIGNSYFPKVIEIEPGTRVTWVNEDVFTFMDGEFAGIHNAVGTRGPAMFATRMLAHAESDSVTLTESGTYEYMCTPHPYMQGRIIVRETAANTDTGPFAGLPGGPLTALAAIVVLFLLSAVIGAAMARRSHR